VKLKKIIFSGSYLLWALGLVVALFLIIYPFIPEIKMRFLKAQNPQIYQSSYYEQKYDLTNQIQIEKTDTPLIKISVDPTLSDRLIIPVIGVDIELYFNEDQTTALNKGAWVVPGSANPGEKGEMVVTAHRFQALPPAQNTFYHLDKVKVGDTSLIFTGGFAYKYEVTSTKVLGAEEFKFNGAESTVDDMVLYTCTPLWTASHRLIVHSKQIPFN